ncbi:MAG: hypothetical protein LBG60_14070, partial [Bifidobacteriaceae bacterium]|nr:hypothetical protein [Bifidobacteriaceae bacterium]
MRQAPRARGRRSEDGMTMVSVLGSFTIILVVLLGSVSFLGQQVKYSRHQQDSDLALAAAEAGVADILTELRIDPEYLDSISSTKDEPTGYCEKDATGGPPSDGDVFAGVCGWTAATAPGWQKLGGDEGG